MARGNNESRALWNMRISTPFPEFPSRLSSYTAWQYWPTDERDSVCLTHFAETPPPHGNLSPEAKEREAAAGLEKLIQGHEGNYNREHCKPYEAYVVAETSSWVQRMYALIAHLDVMPRSALLHYTTGCHKLDSVIPPLCRLMTGDYHVWQPLGFEILVNHLLLHGTIARNKEFRRAQRWESARGVEKIRTTLLELGYKYEDMMDKFAEVLDKKIKSFAQAPQQEQLRETLELLLGCSARVHSMKGQVMDSFIEGMVLAWKYQLERERDANVGLEGRQLFAIRRTAVVEARVISWVVTGKKIASRWCNPAGSHQEEFTEHLARSVAEKLAVEPELWQLAKRAFLCIPELASAFWDLLPAYPAHYKHTAADRPGWAPRRRANAAQAHADPFELVRLNPGKTVPETSSCLAEGAPFGRAAAPLSEPLSEGEEGGGSKSASSDESSDNEEGLAGPLSKRNVLKWLIEGSLDESWEVDSDDVMDGNMSDLDSGLRHEEEDDPPRRGEEVFEPEDEGHRALSGLVRAERTHSEVQLPEWEATKGKPSEAFAAWGGPSVLMGERWSLGDKTYPPETSKAGALRRTTPSAGGVEAGGSGGAVAGFPVADPTKKGKPETIINMWPDGQLRVVQTAPQYVRGGVPCMGNSGLQDESVCSGGLFEGPVWSADFPQVGFTAVSGGGYQPGFEFQFLQDEKLEEGDRNDGESAGNSLRGEGEWPSDWDSDGEPSFGWEIDGAPSVEKTVDAVTGVELHRLSFENKEDSFFGEGEYQSGGESDEEPSLNWRIRGGSKEGEDSVERPDWLADWGSEDSDSDDSDSVSGGGAGEPEDDSGGGGAEIEVESGGGQEATVGTKRKKRSDAGKPREKRADKRLRLIDELEGFDDPDLDPAEIEGLKAAFVDEALAAEAAARKGGKKAGEAAPRGKKPTLDGAPDSRTKRPSYKRKVPVAELVLGWGGLQTDLLVEILRRTSPETTVVMSAVCKSWKPVALSDEVWSQHYVNEFGELPRAKPLNKGGLSSMSWHKAFCQRDQASGTAHICPECGRPCAKKSDLERHLKLAHTGGLQCQLCSETTRYRSEKGLKWHVQEKHREDGVKLHTGRQDLQCAHCTARCKSQETLDEHVKSMHTERDQLEYVCTAPKCSFVARTLYKLKRHCRDTKHKLPPPHLACPRPGCTFRAYTRPDVRQHAYSHSSQCAECGFQYPPGYKRWGPHPEMPEIGICDGCRARAYRSSLTDRPRVRLALDE